MAITSQSRNGAAAMSVCWGTCWVVKLGVPWVNSGLRQALFVRQLRVIRVGIVRESAHLGNRSLAEWGADGSEATKKPLTKLASG